MAFDDSWVALSLLRHIGYKTLNKLLEHFGSTDEIIRASTDDLIQVRGIGAKIAEAITSIDMDAIRRDIEDWQTSGIYIIPYRSDDYPGVLKDLGDAPLTLFARGNYQPEKWRPGVAIVGTRHPSPQAKSVATDLAEAYAEKGWTIISGLALGIDTAAHNGALAAKSSQTVAVTGGGVLNIYPAENQALAERILEQGAIISENAPYASSSAPRLVTRNRIISGLCQHVIVVQSDVNGGAMHAAKATIKQNRELFTLNWQHFSGNRALLKDGAKAIDPDNLDIPNSAS